MKASPPPPPPGHYSTKATAASFQTLADIAFNPCQPAHVRSYHRNALESSLASLAALVSTVTR